ncbi:MAG: M23 family metallopeptidase, partial [Bacteroidetes bacterium]|nr:M23 family metallopeptidase [Bacteroidota bacterium]
THDRTGYPVVASRDGYIVRIRISPNGYGKMLYVRHDDHYTTTYAHLDRFASDLDERATREQYRRGSYSVDIECTPDEFPVRKGDLIAYSGETGSGSPHLHFEIRDENLNAVNPLLCPAFKVKDDLPPIVRKIAFIPLGHESTVNGRSEPLVMRPRKAGENQYTVPTPVRITGAVGLAIDNRDRSNGTWFRHGIYRNSLEVDGRMMYRATFDRVPTREAHQIALYYIWPLLRKGRFQKLYADSPNDLPFYEPNTDSAGIIRSGDYAEGVHNWRIAMQDIYGNSSEVSGSMIINHAPSIDLVASGDSLRVTFQSTSPIREITISTRRNREKRWRSTVRRLDPEEMRSGLFVPVPSKGCDVLRIVAENGYGTRSRPAFHFVNKPARGKGTLTITHEPRDDYVLFTVSSDAPFTTHPTAVLHEGKGTRQVQLEPLSLQLYAGTYRLAPSIAGVRRFIVDAEVSGEPTRGEHAFEVYPIVPGATGSYEFDDGKFILSYDPESTYKTVFLQVEKWDDNGRPVYT